MKCPKCGFNSFEYLDNCKKCGNSLAGFKGAPGLRPVVLEHTNGFSQPESEKKLVAPIVDKQVEEAPGKEFFQWDTPSKAESIDKPVSEASFFDIAPAKDQPASSESDNPFSFGIEFENKPQNEPPKPEDFGAATAITSARQAIESPIPDFSMDSFGNLTTEQKKPEQQINVSKDAFDFEGLIDFDEMDHISTVKNEKTSSALSEQQPSNDDFEILFDDLEESAQKK